MNELVQKLTQEQPIVATTRPENSLEQLKASVDRGYVFCKFTETRGGTELGIRLDPERSDVAHVDWTKPEGNLHIVGELTLDYVRVRFHGDVDVSTWKGTGRLEILEDLDAKVAAPEPAGATES